MMMIDDDDDELKSLVATRDWFSSYKEHKINFEKKKKFKNVTNQNPEIATTYQCRLHIKVPVGFVLVRSATWEFS